MLPRRLIMEHPWLVMEGLLLRSSLDATHSAREKEAVLQVYELGGEALRVQKEKEALQQERNVIAKSFKTGDREALQARGLAIKDKLETLEKLHKELEDKIRSQEELIPNLPAPGVPISRARWERRGILDEDLGYEEYVQYKQAVLRLLQSYREEYNQ